MTTLGLKRARRSALAVCIAAGLAGLSLVAPAANAADGVSDGGDSGNDLIADLLAPTVDDDLTNTIVLLGQYGLDDVDPRFAGIFTLEAAPDGELVTVRYPASHPMAGELIQAVEQAKAEAPIAIEALPVSFDVVAAGEVARQLTAVDSPLAREYGLTPTIAVVDQHTGQVVVETSGDSARSAGDTNLTIDGVSVVVRAGDGAPTDFQVSRDADAPNWSGGIWLSNGSYAASMGFTWKRWSDGELMGSTAEHNYQIGGVSTWYNNGSVVGNRYFYHVQSDITLLRSSPKSKFNANMYVGTSTTTVRRNVVTALNSLPLTTQIALNARSGLKAATPVYASGVYSNGTGPFVLTTSGNCLGGDSGGPWIRTESDGDVVAAGQHVGRALYGGGYRCVVAPLGPMSAAVDASIYTG